jgi:hypothetical protein
MTSAGVDAVRRPRTVRGLDRSGVRSQESGVRSQEAWAAGAASLTRYSRLAPRHFLHEHLFTSSYARWLLENNWPDSKRPRFLLSLELPRSRHAFLQTGASNLARGLGVAIATMPILSSSNRLLHPLD